jgi:hypothetical protein
LSPLKPGMFEKDGEIIFTIDLVAEYAGCNP